MGIISRRKALSLALSSLAVAGSASGSQARSGHQIDADVRDTLYEFDRHIRGSRDLLERSAAVLVFPP